MSLFMDDLQFVQDLYSDHKEHPPIARNLPPISGKIAWARQLYRRISGPVEVFQKNQELMALPETKKAVKKYNRLARVLVEYELIFVQVLSREISQAKASLNSTVLVRHPETKMLVVNFDRKILEVMREIEVLTKMGLELPPQAKPFSTQEKYLKRKVDMIKVSYLILEVLTNSSIVLLQHMVSEDARIRSKVPEIFEPMMFPHLERVDEMVSPGLTILRWTSLNIEAFVDSVTTSLQSLELLIDRASDIWEIQIEGNLKAIQTTQLCVLPGSEPWTPDEFVSKTQVCACVRVGVWVYGRACMCVCVGVLALRNKSLVFKSTCTILRVSLCSLTCRLWSRRWVLS